MKYRRYIYLQFILPALLVYGFLFIYPAFSAFWLSLTDWDGISNRYNFIGLQNYKEAFVAPEVLTASWHNAFMFIVVFLVLNTIGLFIAVLINNKPRFYQFYRTVLFLPVILSLVAIGFIWSLILDPNIGFLNPILRDIGLGKMAIPWLSDTTFAFPSVIVVQCWYTLGLAIIIYSAGLQNIPQELKDAAKIDGASNWQSFLNVTFPLLAPAFTSLTLIIFIRNFRVFDTVYILGGPDGAPAGATDVLGTLIYRTAFGAAFVQHTRFGYAISIAVITFAVLGFFSAILILALRKREVKI